MGNKTITIGRDKKCDLVIEDIPQNAKVSGRHATITEVIAEGSFNKQFILEDHSRNGTFVNSDYVHNGTYKIKEGDIITLGRDYVLDWSLILPYFEGRKTNRKPFGKETMIKPQNGMGLPFDSADPVYPDPLPIVSEGATSPISTPDNKPGQGTEKEFVFTGLHWLITIGAFFIGLIFGILM